MRAATAGAFVPNDEVDELRWVTREQAAQLLTYERDREVLARW
jgi:8-oxo-(d)GTP phosphatase